jgi:hypothetical protein
MIANVLRVSRAVDISVLAVRAFVREKQGRTLTRHEVAILKLLAESRRLAKFPEPSRRPIGCTAELDHSG